MATVRVYGPAWMDVDGEKLTTFPRNAAKAQGWTIDEDEIGVLVTLFSAMAAQETPLDGTVKLVKEGGRWLVCDSLPFLDQLGGFDLPLRP